MVQFLLVLCWTVSNSPISLLYQESPSFSRHWLSDIFSALFLQCIDGAHIAALFMNEVSSDSSISNIIETLFPQICGIPSTPTEFIHTWSKCRSSVTFSHKSSPLTVLVKYCVLPSFPWHITPFPLTSAGVRINDSQNCWWPGLIVNCSYRSLTEDVASLSIPLFPPATNVWESQKSTELLL